MGASGPQPHHPEPEALATIGEALGRIPTGLFILTAEHEDRRMGMLASFVQQCCFEPPMITVAVAKGRAIMPLISESRQFGLCQLGDDDRVILRKFSSSLGLGEDPFLGFEMIAGRTPNLPLLASSIAYLECELTCHLDVEGDHDLFVGAVRAGGCTDKRRKPRPQVRIRKNGFDY
jgi:flavin reductase (DIM6/NTAB) family NADH-FMN oxidoreductase RutF